MAPGARRRLKCHDPALVSSHRPRSRPLRIPQEWHIRIFLILQDKLDRLISLISFQFLQFLLRQSFPTFRRRGAFPKAKEKPAYLFQAEPDLARLCSVTSR